MADSSYHRHLHSYCAHLVLVTNVRTVSEVLRTQKLRSTLLRTQSRQMFSL